MSGFADLVASANPALVGGGCNITVTEGRDLSCVFNAVDDANDPVDLTDATGSCLVLDEGGNTVAELTFTGTTTGCTISATAAELTALANSLPSRSCYWKLSITLGGQTLQAWSGKNSHFTIWES